MADNVLIATKNDVNGAHQQVVQEFLDGGGAPVQVSAANPLPVEATIDPAGLATSAIQTDGTQKTQIVDAGGDAVTVTGGKLDVNASVDTTGLATSALQGTGNTSLATIAGAVAGTEIQVDVLTMPTTTVQATNLDIRDLTFAADKVDASGSVLGAGNNNIGDVDIASIAAGDNNIGNVDIVTMPSVTLNALPAGNNNIGDVDVASVAGNVTVVQGTGTNLHTVVDSGTITTVSTVTSVTQNPDIRQATASNLNAQVVGNLAHDAVDSGNPIKIGGKVSSSIPTTVANADRVDAWLDQWGRQVVSDMDVELGNTIGSTSLRDRLMAQRMTVLADSLADGLAGFWTSSTANGGTATSTSGEGLIQTSANATGSAQITSTIVAYFPGQVAWFNSAVRFNDTGSAGNTRRIGVFTVSGTTPQDGFYYELSGTTLNAVVCKGGTPTAVDSASWSRVAVAPFTLDTNYHSFEIRYTANSVFFYVDNVLRNVITGTTTAITTTLNFPITIQSINTSGATNRLIAVRNCGIGRFGNPEQTVNETGLSSVWAIAVGGGTPHDSVDSGNPLKLGGKASAAPPSAVADNDRVNAWFTPTGTLNVTPTPSTGGGWSTFMATSADGSTALVATAQAIKASAGTFGGYYIFNPNSVQIYVSIYNVVAASVTVGTTNPQNSFCIPPLAAANLEITNGINFSTAMSCAATTTGGGNTAPSIALEANFWFK